MRGQEERGSGDRDRRESARRAPSVPNEFGVAARENERHGSRDKRGYEEQRGGKGGAPPPRHPESVPRGKPQGGINGCPEEGINGNWRCFGCNNINFGHRTTCNRCKAKR